MTSQADPGLSPVLRVESVAAVGHSRAGVKKSSLCAILRGKCLTRQTIVWTVNTIPVNAERSRKAEGCCAGETFTHQIWLHDRMDVDGNRSLRHNFQHAGCLQSLWTAVGVAQSGTFGIEVRMPRGYWFESHCPESQPLSVDLSLVSGCWTRCPVLWPIFCFREMNSVSNLSKLVLVLE